jgi:hypothetical protein
MISAADLKFLRRLPHARTRNFKSTSGTEKFELPVPLLFPKFVSEASATVHEHWKRGAGTR